MGGLLSLMVGCIANCMGATPALAEPPLWGRTGVTLYVSKLGDNSDGVSWARAFTTLQAALSAIPDDKGGHRVVVRPDIYMEPNISTAFKGAQGAYNLFVGDVDGRYGSGKTGHVVIDAGDPEKGFKSYDWWGTLRSYKKGWSKDHVEESFSAKCWDRWVLRNLYVTGGDGGLMWDLVDNVEPFTVVVEDCIALGRAFGGGVGNCLSRTDEPIVFRRCHLTALDWWGDTAAAYCRVENEAMLERPDIYFEDCTMVSPQCALKAGNYGFHTYTHVKATRCKLIVLNFSQPVGTPSDGIILSMQNGKYLSLDLEDCTLMGYKVFGVKVDKDSVGEIQFTTKGDVKAYVQFQQDLPKGFHRLNAWPTDIYSAVAPPPAPAPKSALKKEDALVARDLCEVTPVIWKGRLCMMECVRPAQGGTRKDYCLLLRDVETGKELARFAEGYGLASAFVHDDTFYASASRWGDDNSWNDVTIFKSKDLQTWESKLAIQQEKESLFNSSVCAGPDGFTMVYESNDPTYPAFTIKLAQSKDMETWTKLPDAAFGTNRYTACPCIRFVNGYYYVLYTEHRTPLWRFETYVTRSKDLKTWELSAANPVLAPEGVDEGINNSDPDTIEYNGNTFLYYAAGDQLTWMNIKRAAYPGTLGQFFESYYVTPGIVDKGTASAAQQPAAESTDDARDRRTAWFRDAKFGLFVHWGTYAVRAKNEKGVCATWSMNDDKVPVAEYEQYAERFQPTKFDANRWMDIAKSAGMRYMIFTSKHHEGYSMFDTALSTYSAAKGKPGRDFVRELVTAARASDMHIGFYYSMLDWHHPDYSANFAKYVDEYLFGQVRELCTNYGPIDCIWFDGEWDRPKADWKSEALIAQIRGLQPNALINDRVGKDERGKNRLVDFYTREQPVEIDKSADFEKHAAIPWEACMTIGESWGYKEGDAPLKSATELIRRLVAIVSRGGNLLLNVGPNADGEIPAPLVERLEAIGTWIKANGESIYGTTASPFANLPAGKCTAKDNRLYIHLETHPGAPISLPGLQNDIRRAWFLKTGEPLRFDNTNKQIYLPEQLCDEAVTTVGIELDGTPVVK